MGQGQPTQFSNNALKKFQDHYVFVSEKSDERWGTVQIWKEKAEGHQVMIFSKSFHNDEEFKTYTAELKIRAALEHPNLIQLIGWSNEDSDGICGHSRKFNLYVEYLSQNLDKEIKRRTANKEFFEEAELWYLAKTIIAFGAFLEEQGLSHGDIRPQQVLLTDSENDDGQIKLADNGLYGLFRTGYILTFSGAGKAYLSPELMNAYAKKVPDPQYDVYRADVYSLGMTLLHAASLKDPHVHFYDWFTKDVRHEAMQSELEALKSQYSNQLVQFIATLLQEDLEERPDFLHLSQTQPTPNVVKPLVSIVKPAPIYTPPVTYVQPQPTYVQPQPTYVQPTIVQPQQTYVQPKPTYVQPKPTYVQPTQTYVQPPQTKVQPTQTYVKPQTTYPSSYVPPVQQTYVPPVQQSYVPTAYHQSFVPQTVGYPQSKPFGSQYPGGGIRYVNQQSPAKRFDNVEDLSDLDKRVQEAIRTTEETINRNSQVPNLVETQNLGDVFKEEQPEEQNKKE